MNLKKAELLPLVNPPIGAKVNMTISFPGVALSTKRLSVTYIACAALANWYYMVKGKFNISPLASKAFIAVMATKGLPFCGRILPPAGAFSRAANVFIGGSLSWVILFPLLSTLGYPFWIFAAVSSASLRNFISYQMLYLVVIISSSFFGFGWVALSPSALINSYLFRVPLLVLSFFLAVVLIPLSRLFPRAINAVFIGIVSYLASALPTRSTKKGFCHEKIPFGTWYAKEDSVYNPFATGAYVTCRHAPGCLHHRGGFPFIYSCNYTTNRGLS